jgi:hypothetical protein
MTVDRDRAGRTPLHYAVTDDPVGLDYTKALSDPAVAEANCRRLMSTRSPTRLACCRMARMRTPKTTRVSPRCTSRRRQEPASRWRSCSSTRGPTSTHATITMKRRCIWRWPIKRRESFPSCDFSANAVPMRQYRRTTGSPRSNTLNATEGRSYANCSPIYFEANGTCLASNPAS